MPGKADERTREASDETATSSPVTAQTQPTCPGSGAGSADAPGTLPTGGAAPHPTAFRNVDDADYEIVGDLARGGQGRIRHARDRRHGRPVAIKELLRSSPEARQRFQREAFITARLQHPAIVPLYEAGTWNNGELFYSMKLVEGESLDKVVARTRTLSERIALLPRVITVAEAVAYAHDRRIIHRDLKPSNILVGDLGETVVIDWGLAKQLGDPDVDERSPTDGGGTSDALTVAGRAMGTPSYMPPEQARGDEVDERADVYALGAVLYHVLTGRAPYGDAGNARAQLARLAAAPPRSLASAAPDAPRDLITIVEKAMARDAGARYPRARELAADLRRFEAGQLVGAHAYSAREIATRWMRRHRAIVAVIAAAALVAASVAALSFRRVASERDTARRFARASETARGEAADRVEQLSLERARAILATDPTRALELARAIPAASRWSGLAQLTASVAEIWGVSTVVWRGNTISSFAASADGRTLAWGADTTLRVRHADGSIAEHTVPDPIFTVAVSPDGGRVAAGTFGGHVFLATGAQPPVLLEDVTIEGGVRDVSLDEPDLLLAATREKTYWWELAGSSPRFVQPTTAAPGPAPRAADDVFLSARREGFVELWSRREARLVERLVGYMPGWTIRAARVSADRSRFLYVDEHRVLWTRALADGTPQRVDALAGRTAIVWVGNVLGEHVIVDALGGVHVWHGPGAVVDTIVEPSATQQAVSAAVVGDDLAIGYDSGDIAIVDPRRGLQRTLHGHVGNVFALAAAGDGDTLTLTSASRDGTIRQWRMMPAGVASIALGAARVASVAVTRDGTVAVGGEDGVVRLWKPGAPATVLDRAFTAREMVLSADDRYLVWSRGPTQGGVRLADLGVADHPRFELEGCGRYPRFAASVARFACVRNFDGATLLWNTETWTPITVDTAGPVQVDSMSISADGTQVVSGRLEEGADFRLWDTRSGAARILSRIHGNVVASAFRPGGDDVITGDLARRVRWFRLSDGTSALLGQEGAAISQVVAGTRFIAVGKADGMVGIWDVERGMTMHVRPPRTNAGQIVDLRLTADETMLVALHKRGQVVIWDIASGVGLPLPGNVGAIGLSSDGRLLALGDDGGNVWRVTMPSPTAGARGEGEWTPFEPAWKPLAPVTPPSPTSARERADRDARDAMAQRAAADEAFRRGGLDDAVTYYRRAVAAGDADSSWRLAVVDAYRTHRDDPNAAMRAAVVRVGLETPWTSTAPIDVAVAARDTPAATRAEILRAWALAAGENVTSLNYLVYYLIRSGELELAGQVAERLLRVADDSTEFDAVAEVFNARGEAARAIALAERAVALDPKDEILRANLRRFRRARREIGADVFLLQEPPIGPYTPARVPLPAP